MAARARTSLVTLTEALPKEDGSITATVVIGKDLSGRLQATGSKWREYLRRAVTSGLNDMLGSDFERIVAYVPLPLVDSFDAYCDELGLPRSRVLLGCISRYVDEDGDRTEKQYNPNITQVLPRHKGVQTKSVQIFAPREQVKGFDSFCRGTGTKKNVFIMREMIRKMNIAAKKRAQGAAPVNQRSVPAAP
jgi:hypothetical protein